MFIMPACELNGQYKRCIGIIDALEKQDFGNLKYELSEVLMFKNSVIEKLGDPSKTLKHLLEIDSKVVDRLGFDEQRGLLVSQFCSL